MQPKTPQKSGAPMNEAIAIRTVLPKHTRKRLARLMSVPFSTTHEWLYRRFSTTRRQELARALLAEMEEQEVARSAVRRQLAAWAAED